MLTTEDSEVVRNLIKAREIIKRNWVKRFMRQKIKDYPTTEYGFCALGAMHAAKYGEDKQPRRSRIPYEELVLFREANKLGCVENWNDHHKRKKEEVIAAFDKAIDLARESQSELDHEDA